MTTESRPAKPRVAFERWFKRSEQYMRTVAGLRDAFNYEHPWGYYYQSVDDSWRAFKAGRKAK